MSRTAKRPLIPKFHTINDVAQRLGLSPRSVRRLIDSGVLRAFKFGAAVRVSDEDLLLLIAQSHHNVAV